MTKDHLNGFLFLVPGEGSIDQVEVFNEEVIKLQLRTVKLIVMILNLRPSDFTIRGGVMPATMTEGLFNYLFSHLPEGKKLNKDLYYKSADVLYFRIRQLMKKLTPDEIIVAKQIIHDLNGNVVRKVVSILGLQDFLSHPEDLMDKIKATLMDPTTDKNKKDQVKKITYEEKVNAIKQLILLLNIKMEDLIIPQYVPKDLKLYLFSSDSMQSLSRQKKSATVEEWQGGDQNNEDIIGVFCMSCFHRLYTSWKKAHQVSNSGEKVQEEEMKQEEEEEEEEEEGPQARIIAPPSQQNENRNKPEREAWKSLEFLENETFLKPDFPTPENGRALEKVYGALKAELTRRMLIGAVEKSDADRQVLIN